MSMRSGDADAIRARKVSGEGMTGSESNELLKTQIRLALAEKRIVDMKREWVRESERATAAERRVSELAAAKRSVDSAEMVELRRKMEQAISEKDVALLLLSDSERNAESTPQDMGRLITELRDAQSTIEQLMKDLEEARSVITSVDQATVNQLHKTLTARDVRIKQLVKKYDDFTSEHFKLLKQANKDGEELEVLQERNKIQDRELKELRARFACIETNRDWFKKENTRLSTETNTHRANITKLNAQVTNLHNAPKDDVAKLKAQVLSLTSENKPNRTRISVLQKKINMLNYDIGFFITHLDLANADCRIFTCRHDNYKNIPKGQASAHKHDAGTIATEYFNDWKKDPEFIKEYKDARVGLVDHHRQHERAGEGRAEAASSIKSTLENIDRSRGVKISYG
ncbi:hypothetical protein BDU57DRAFT_568584 [Ampelomyces quisqualis]|uniref:Uncharacterized protein n=1 Tax=Ampelomyces quisqualis TaxID=50730 RepID=A0A6A5QUZ7_AMPQU|nr:hypothetical protein BDU57DRAFT_568584 [Ampelomyces quisqualis]